MSPAFPALPAIFAPTSKLTVDPTCPRLDAPIVMTHGLFGFHRIGLGPVTLAWYFRGIPEILRAGGNRVFVPRVHPTAGTARRARKLAERIEGAFPGERFHLIGHSMGGLDGRALLAEPAWRSRVLSLTTIATPHLGSSIADFAKIRAGRIYGLLDRIGLDHHGFFDVTRRAAARFHRANPIPAGLPAFSVAGIPAVGSICWPLRRLHSAMEELEGPNDGLVGADSATAVGEALPAWPVDHLRQMNWLSSGVPGLGGQVAALYGGLVANLAARGFAA